MAKTQIREDHYDTIVQALYNKSCVPFLGAGVNLTCADDEPGLPLGGEVALRLVESMIPKRNLVNPSSAIKTDKLCEYRRRTNEAVEGFREVLPAAFDQLEERLKDAFRSVLPDDDKDTRLAHVIIDDALDQFKDLTRVALQDLARVSMRYRVNKDLKNFVAKLKELIPDNERKPSPLLRTLARLPLRLIVTTNYDRLMERSLELFQEDAVRDPRGLAAEVWGSKTPLARFVRRLTSPASAEEAALMTAAQWADDLNWLIQEKCLYHLGDKNLLRLGVTREVWDLTDRKPEGLAQVARNRKVLESSFPGRIAAHAKPYEVIVQPIGGFKGARANYTQQVLSESDEATFVYKLHGTFTDGEPDEETRPVITEEDYIEFLTFVGGNGEGINNQIKDQIQQSTLLFLGYSLEDWNFRALFKGLIEKAGPDKQRVSYAIQKDPSDFWVTFWDKKGVQILDVDICEFGAELDRRCREHHAKQQALELAAKKEREQRWQEWGREGGEKRKVVRVAKY